MIVCRFESPVGAAGFTKEILFALSVVHTGVAQQHAKTNAVFSTGECKRMAVNCSGVDDRRGFKHMPKLAFSRSCRAVDWMTPVGAAA
jgi:hypothetical protein